MEAAPAEKKPLTEAVIKPTKAEPSNSTPASSNEEIKKAPKTAPKPAPKPASKPAPKPKEKSRVRRIEIQDLSDDEDS